jgi:hypothetical protein
VVEDEYSSLESDDNDNDDNEGAAGNDGSSDSSDKADKADNAHDEDDAELSLHHLLGVSPSLSLPDVRGSPLLQRRQSRVAQDNDDNDDKGDNDENDDNDAENAGELDVSAVPHDSDVSEADPLDAELHDTALPASSELLAVEDNIRVGLMSLVLDSIHRYQNDPEVLSEGQLDLIFTPDTVLAMVDDPELELRVMAVQIVDFCLRRRVPNFTRRFLRAQGFQVRERSLERVWSVFGVCLERVFDML